MHKKIKIQWYHPLPIKSCLVIKTYISVVWSSFTTEKNQKIVPPLGGSLIFAKKFHFKNTPTGQLVIFYKVSSTNSTTPLHLAANAPTQV